MALQALGGPLLQRVVGMQTTGADSIRRWVGLANPAQGKWGTGGSHSQREVGYYGPCISFLILGLAF